MKKLFLMILLLTVSINVSPATDATDRVTVLCTPPLLPSPPLQLAPYIYQILNSDESTNNGATRSERLQRLIGLKVEGWHISYPDEKKNYKKRSKVTGVIQSIQLIRQGDPGKEIYEMTIHSKENGQKKFAFSGSDSPAFHNLRTINLSPEVPLASLIRDAERDVVLPFDLLSVGLDTPPEVARYKESLRAQKAVVFRDQRYPFHEFSNSYEKAPIVIDGEIWPSVRHYFEAQKFVGPNSNYVIKNIREAITPAQAASIARIMSRDRSFPIRSDWKEVKDEVMFKALTAKFTQHKRLYDLLVSTGDARIVNHVKRDRYWSDGENGNGKSMLGNLLMRLRDQLQQGIMPGYELSMIEVWGLLLTQIAAMSERLNVADAHTLARQIASSNISDIEKIDKMQMILDSAHFFRESERHHITPANEWIALVNKKYPEDMSFRHQVIEIASLFSSY